MTFKIRWHKNCSKIKTCHISSSSSRFSRTTIWPVCLSTCFGIRCFASLNGVPSHEDKVTLNGWTMELFSRRIWRIMSANCQSNLVTALHTQSILFCNFINTSAYFCAYTSLHLQLAVVLPSWTNQFQRCPLLKTEFATMSQSRKTFSILK